MKIEKTWENVEQPPDEKTAGSPWFWLETYKEFHEGLKSIVKELETYSGLAESLELESSPYDKEIRRLKGMIDWGEKKFGTDEGQSLGEITVDGVSYGSLRYLKAGILFRVSQLFQKRAEVIKKTKTVPRSILQTFEERIQQLLNHAEMGMLNGLKPADVFFDIVLSDEQPNEDFKILPQIPSSNNQRTSFEVPIIDPVLRKRCLGILNALEEGGTSDQYDTIIREMSVILEDRVRELSGYAGKLSGVQLLGETMGKLPPQIKFSDEKDIQESAHLLFRGYSGFVRNEVMHGLVSSYTRERVLQLMGMVDYLLFILSNAETTKGIAEESSYRDRDAHR